MDLVEVAEEAISLLRPLMEDKKLTLKLDLQPTVIPGDRDRIGQVVTNLVSNSIQYNCEEGWIDVKVGQCDGHAVLSVADTGAGISKLDQPHVFERFFRSDAARSRESGCGTGLGLAITKWIVDAHGGRIPFRSEPEADTEFTVRLKLED